jgi:hypothetical protein
MAKVLCYRCQSPAATTWSSCLHCGAAWPGNPLPQQLKTRPFSHVEALHLAAGHGQCTALPTRQVSRTTT